MTEIIKNAEVFAEVQKSWYENKKATWTKYNNKRTKEQIQKNNQNSWKKVKNDKEKLEYRYNKTKKYNLTKLEKLAGRAKPLLCEICNQNGKICFDHSHNKNNFRGWICDACNRILGISKDNPETLRKCAEYLEKDKI